MMVQGELACTIIRHCGIVTTPLPFNLAVRLEMQVRRRLGQFSYFHDMPSPHSQLDPKHHLSVPQMLFLYVLAHVIIVTVLSPLIQAASSMTTEETLAGKRGIEAAISLVRMIQDASEAVPPEGLDHSFLSFAVYRTATILCQAVVDDIDGILPYRPEVLCCIGASIEIHECFSTVRPAISTAYEALLKLAQQLLLHPEEKANISRGQMHHSLTPPYDPFPLQEGQQSPLVLFGSQPGNGDGAGPGPGLGIDSGLQVAPPLLPTDYDYGQQQAGQQPQGFETSCDSFVDGIGLGTFHMDGFGSVVSWPYLFQDHESQYVTVQGSIVNLSLEN